MFFVLHYSPIVLVRRTRWFFTTESRSGIRAACMPRPTWTGDRRPPVPTRWPPCPRSHVPLAGNVAVSLRNRWGSCGQSCDGNPSHRGIRRSGTGGPPSRFVWGDGAGSGTRWSLTTGREVTKAPSRPVIHTPCRARFGRVTPTSYWLWGGQPRVRRTSPRRSCAVPHRSPQGDAPSAQFRPIMESSSDDGPHQRWERTTRGVRHGASHGGLTRHATDAMT